MLTPKIAALAACVWLGVVGWAWRAGRGVVMGAATWH